MNQLIMDQSVLYLECNSGISGDMTVAALLDLGADHQVLLDALASLPLTGYSIEIKDVYKSGLRACDFNVVLEHDNHDHDMEYLHGHIHEAESNVHGHIHEIEAGAHGPVHEHTTAMSHDIHKPVCEHVEAAPHKAHDHELHLHDTGSGNPEQLHSHAHVGGAPHTPHTHVHTHESRNLQDITEIINAGKLSASARALALRIFRILAEAEASVHGKSVDEIHFHEVGAVDSIVDIVAAAVCLDDLHPARVIVSPLTDGTGQIRCQHGIIPVPVPAVTAIAAQNGLTLKLTDIEGELVTPTGAAIAAALQSASPSADITSTAISPSDAPQTDASQSAISLSGQNCFGVSCSEQEQAGTRQAGTASSGQEQTNPHRSGHGLPAEFRIRKIGLGAGKRDYATTGVLRAMLLEPQSMMSPAEGIFPQETNRADNTVYSFQGKLSDFNHQSPEVQNCSDDSSDTILSLESNIDDCTGEALSFTMQELLDHGALDVFYVPIYMKKNRPAYLLRVLCHADRRARLESIMFKNTTTIGIRVQEMHRTKLPRQIVSIETPWGRADVKCCTHNGETYCYPENDSVSELARKNQIGFPEMYHQIQEYSKKTLGK